MTTDHQKISVQRNGPYLVKGGIPLVRRAPVMSEHGEPVAWGKGDYLADDDVYLLCRCGQSSNKPFCDGTHTRVGFDGTEAGDKTPISSRQKVYEGTEIVVKDDRSICTHAGFCSNRVTNVWKMTPKTDDAQVRDQLMAMIERCPSGALSYSLEPEGEDVEPDLPGEIVVTQDGPLWVTGRITVEGSDGQPIEIRNRMTLCRCGNSKAKPLCDGSHKDIGFIGK